MSDTNTLARSLHDVGLAAWFGGALMGAVGLNGAAASLPDPTQRADAATSGWKRWAPVNAVAIGAHLVGGAIIVASNKSRLTGQAGVGAWTGVKTGLTVAALAATAASGVAGSRLDKAAQPHVTGTTEPSDETPDAVAKAQKALRPLQWAIPVLTGAILVVSARMGEQQRPAEVATGLLHRVLPD